jgi:hypothetical protein
MKVIPFRKRIHDESAPHWQGSEMQRMTDACAGSLARGDVSGWETGATEAGDPQLYVLGPEPERECLVCVSRLGRLYVLEDGHGRILFEDDAIDRLAAQVRGTLQRKKGAIVARAVMAWVAIRETFEEKVEPVLAEPVEVLSHVAPQFAAMI